MTISSLFFKRINSFVIFDKAAFNSFLVKMEVLTDSNLIVNSVRILILVAALLLSYIHSSERDKNDSGKNKIELKQQSVISVNNDSKPYKIIVP